MKTRFFLFGLVLICLTSCAGFTHVTVPSSPVVITEGDVVTDRYVECKLHNTYIFGLGGIRSSNLVGELVQKANLGKNEALAYVSAVKNVNCFLGIITVVTHTVSGYVVRPEGVSGQSYSGVSGLTAEEAYLASEIKNAKYKRDFSEIQDSIDRLYDGGKLTEIQKNRLQALLDERKAAVDNAVNGKYSDGIYR